MRFEISNSIEKLTVYLFFVEEIHGDNSFLRRKSEVMFDLAGK
jgi:hypothetical protein